MLQICSCPHTHAPIPDFLVEADPDSVMQVHDAYLKAGADIIETNSFNCNYFSLKEFKREDSAYTLARKAASIARKAADSFSALTPDKPRFVAGAVGPTNLMLSFADENGDFNFDSLSNAYKDQIRGLLDGGADIIAIETAVDILNVKGALFAIEDIEKEKGIKIPVIVTATIDTKTGRLPSGQSFEAFYATARHPSLLAVGLNCGTGSEDLIPILKRLSEIADTPVVVYPNAGIPDGKGQYNESPDIFAENLKGAIENRLVNIVGGCCGTTPEHIARLNSLLNGLPTVKCPRNSR